MLDCHSRAVRHGGGGRTAFLTYLAIAVVALLSSDAAAQLAPTGGHYAGRASDSGHGAGQVNPSGGFSAAVPLDFPPARGGLPIPVSIVYGARGMGAAGVGWDVPLSYVRRDMSLAHRRPASNSDLPRGEPRVTVSLMGRIIDVIQDGPVWVARRDSPGLVLLEGANQWTLHDGNGLTYTFVPDPDFPTTDTILPEGIWLLKSISGPGNARVELFHKVTNTPLGEGELISIDLERVQYNRHPSADAFKHEIILVYDGATAAPQSLSVLGNHAIARTRKLTNVEVRARAGTGSTSELLSDYRLTYANDQDTGQPRLASVTVAGRSSSAADPGLPLASYNYGTATQMRVPPTTSGPEKPYLRYEKTQQIRIPSGAGEIFVSRTLWEDWSSSGFPAPPAIGKDGFTQQNLIDITGDGRPDLVFKDQSGKLRVSRNIPGNGGVSIIDDPTKIDELNDFAMTSGLLETRTISRPRYDTSTKDLSVHEVWRKVIDVNGDGRLDIIDAAEKDEAWVIYINAPVAGQPWKVQWKNYFIPIRHLVEQLEARGHEPFSHEPFGHHPHHDGSKHLALERSTTGVEVEAHACFRAAGKDWELFREGSCENPPPNNHLPSAKQKTYTEWALTDFNGDGYPDLVMNTSPVKRFTREIEPPFDGPVPALANGSIVRGLEPEDGNANGIDVAYTNGRLILFFTEAVPLKEHAPCGMGLTTADKLATVCTANNGSYCTEYEVVSQDVPGSESVVCEISDVNGDGLIDYTVNGTASFLGTGSAFLSASLMSRSVSSHSRNDAFSMGSCNAGHPTDTFFFTSQSGGLRDLNGDGIPDEISGSSVRIGTGAGFGPSIPIDIIGESDGDLLSRGLDRCDGHESRTRGGFYDLDGDGKPEFLKMHPGGAFIDVYQLVGSGGPRALDAGRLTQIDNGHGAQTKITYRSAKDDATTLHQVPFPEIVVSSIETIGTADLGGDSSPTNYAYGGAQLMFDPAVERFTFPGYARAVELKTVTAVVDFNRVQTGSVVRITDSYPAEPATGTTPLNEAFGRYLRAGRPRDVTVLAGSMSADPWTMLALNIDNDSRRIGSTHYEWDARAFAGTTQNPSPSECSDLLGPYAFSATSMNVCTTHGFAFQRSTSSWRGTTAPPSTDNVMTTSEVRSIDDFGRPLTVFHGNDARRNDDDLCESVIYAAQTSSHNRVLSAVTTRRVAHCDGPAAAATATAHWEYDNLQGGVAAGFVTSRTVERRDAQNGQFFETIREFNAVYDAVGNPVSITKVRGDGATRTVTTGYDPYGLAPILIDQTATDAPLLRTVIVRDPVTLEARNVTDPNQITWNTTFDAFGRPVETSFTPPGGSEGLLSTTSYLGFEGGDLLGRRIMQTTFNDALEPGTGGGESRTSTSFLDELGRVRVTTASLGGSYGGTEMIIGARLFDGSGRVVFQADPFPSSQGFNTAYGTNYYYHFDGKPQCSIRANGALLVPPNGTIPTATNEASEIYPTCTFHSFQNGTEITRILDADSLLLGSPQAGVQHFATATAIGWVLDRSTWKNNTRLEHARFLYDRLGHQTQMTRYRDPATPSQPVIASLRYDSLGQLLELQDPDSVARTYKYSHWGELIEQRSAAASTPVVLPERHVVMTYDGLGRMLHREERSNGAVDPATVNSYEYDVGVPVVAEVQPAHMLGRLARATTPTGDVSFSYDALGRNNAQVFTDSQGDPYIQMSEYHADGALAAVDLRLPDTGYSAERVEYTYDSARRIRTMRSVDGLGVQTLYEAPEIDAFGRVRSATIGAAGVATSYADLGRRLPQEIAITSPAGRRKINYLGFDPVGRERSRSESIDDQERVTTATYDALGRLVTSHRTDGASTTLAEHNFFYDALGNLTQLNDAVGHGGATLAYQTTDRDRLCRIDYQANPGGSTNCNVVHDGLGNIVQQPTRTGQRTLSYYASGNVRTIRNQTGTEATFRYDAFGNVQELDLTGTASDARRDRRYGGMIERRDQSVGGQPHSFISRNIPGPGFVASRRGANGPWVFELGSQRGNRFFLDDNGAFVQDVDYEPYGEAVSTGAQPGSALYTTAQWNGGDSIAAFGLSHLGARLYDPVIGRFLSRDPLLIPRTAATTNPYTFAFNDPVNRSDPSGLDPPEGDKGGVMSSICPLFCDWGSGAPESEPGPRGERIPTADWGGGPLRPVSEYTKPYARIHADAGNYEAAELAENYLCPSCHAFVDADPADFNLRGYVRGYQRGYIKGAIEVPLMVTPVGWGWEIGVGASAAITGESSGLHISNLNTALVDGYTDRGRKLSTGERVFEGTTAAAGVLAIGSIARGTAAAGQAWAGTSRPMMRSLGARGEDLVNKAVNSNLSHAIARGVERGIFPSADTASAALRALSAQITQAGRFPVDTLIDTANASRYLVPVGNGGLAVYQVGANGTAKLKTVLIARKP